MASNLTNQSRNVLSKKFMVKKEESLDNITLFSVITIMSFIMMIPIAIFMEGIKFTPSYLHAAGLNVKQICIRSLVAALCFHAYQQAVQRLLERELEPWETIAVGALSGGLAAVVTTPFNVMKTRMMTAPPGQSNSETHAFNYLGFIFSTVVVVLRFIYHAFYFCSWNYYSKEFCVIYNTENCILNFIFEF